MQTNRPKGVAREAQRYELTGVPTSTWYDLQNAGLAPKPIHLGPRSVGWLISELEEWVEARRRERDAAILDKLGTKEPTTDEERGAVAHGLIRKVAKSKTINGEEEVSGQAG